MSLIFYSDKCIACGQCVEVCPFGVLKLEGESLVIGERLQSLRRLRRGLRGGGPGPARDRGAGAPARGAARRRLGLCGATPR